MYVDRDSYQRNMFKSFLKFNPPSSPFGFACMENFLSGFHPFNFMVPFVIVRVGTSDCLSG